MNRSADEQIKSPAPLSIPPEMIDGWQQMVDLVAEITDVPAVLVMRLQDLEIEVLVASRNPDNPYQPVEKVPCGPAGGHRTA